MTICCHQGSLSLLLAVAVGGCLAMASAGISPAAASDFRLGTAAVTITPPLGTPMAGYYSQRGSQGVLDEIYAKAVVLDDGETKAAMVVCDLIGLPRAVVVEARRIIAEKTGIPASHVMISATHTHTGPVVIGDSAMDDMVTGGSKLSKDYAEQLPKWIAQAVEQAHGRRTPARVFCASQDEPDLSFVRRFWMKDGTVGWNPGVGNPNIVRPIGVIDPQVNVVYAETDDGRGPAAGERMAADGSRHAPPADKKPLLTFVNFAMHLDTTGGTLVSADYPATLARRLADYKGPEMLTIFANGACGNINHINVHWAAPQSSPAAAKRLGTILSADVLKAYAALESVEDLALRVRNEVVQLALAKHTDEELRQARDIAARRGANAPFLDQVKAYRILDVAARQGKPMDVDVQVFTLGQDIAWVALPGEVFVELGLNIKAASPFRQTSIIELSNGRSQYIPHHSAFSEGQYEVVSSRYAEGAGELLVTTAIRLLDELHREATAE
ncbi:MAG: neutral/alkaline non-lysosomal ceramidase N-terminal domain-containing protein [Thermoguttaceae bacterium]